MQEESALKRCEPVMFSICKRYYDHLGGRYEFDDLMQAARLGVVDASRSYDAAKGAEFTTHAYNRIRFRINRLVRSDTGVIRIPASATKNAALPQRVAFCKDFESQPLKGISSESRVMLQEAIAKMGEIQRKVITRIYLEDASASTVATEMGVSTNTVYSHAQKALSWLQDYFMARGVNLEALQ
jgi:RNA polymerase sigma factor (sigma-70 family)